MVIVDSHCHLNFPEFEGEIQNVIKEADSNDVKYMQTICTKLSEFEEVSKIANDNKNIFCSLGIHPHEAEKELTTAEELISIAKNNPEKLIGIGETGLDYYYEKSNRGAQKINFIEHLIAASELDLPVIIHTRDAEQDTYDILKDFTSKKSLKGLLHCFTGTADLAKKALDLGLYISISGIVTFKNAKDLQKTVRDIVPLDRLLVETDSPFLAPVPYRGKANQPAYTRKVVEFIAELKNVSQEQVAEKTTDNFFGLFDKAIR
jgi:TatD DNase family protein